MGAVKQETIYPTHELVPEKRERAGVMQLYARYYMGAVQRVQGGERQWQMSREVEAGLAGI